MGKEIFWELRQKMSDGSVRPTRFETKEALLKERDRWLKVRGIKFEVGFYKVEDGVRTQAFEGLSS
jgi:hypothetical protein